MRLSDMRLLVRVAESGSMSLAARQLHLTPAAVSATLRRLEETLGVRIFERTTRSLHPTEDGLVLLEGCHDVLARWQRSLEALEGQETEVVGTVHLAAPADTSYQLLAPIIVELSKAHPKLDVVVHSSDVIQHLHRDAIDIAIRYGPLEDSTLAARRLVEAPGVFVASPSYLDRRGRPTRPEALSGHRCLTLQRSGAAPQSWTLHGDGGVRDVPLEGPLCSDGYLARTWAIAGVGIAMKSLVDVIDDLEAGRLERVLPAYTNGPIAVHAVFPSRRYLPRRVRVLDAAITEAFAALSQRCEAWIGD